MAENLKQSEGELRRSLCSAASAIRISATGLLLIITSVVARFPMKVCQSAKLASDLLIESTYRFSYV